MTENIIYPFYLKNEEKIYTNPLNLDLVDEWKKTFLMGWLKVKEKEFREGFTNEEQIKVLYWLASDKREIDITYNRRATEKVSQENYKHRNYNEQGFDLFCENEIFSFEEFLKADGETIHDMSNLNINFGSCSFDKENYWLEETRLRDIIIDYIQAEGTMIFIKRIGWDISDKALYKNRYTGEEFTFDSQFSVNEYNGDGINRHGTREEWIEYDLPFFFENNCPKEIWTNKNYHRTENSEKQSTLFVTKEVEKVTPNEEESTEEELSDEELTEKYPVESGEVEDEEEQEEPQQTSLFGGSPAEPDNEKKLLGLQQQLWDTHFIKRTIDTIKEVDDGKIFDANEQDGLGREFQIGESGFEELGMMEEDYEKLSYEQYVKKCLEKQIEFQKEELGADIDAVKLMTYEEIEKQQDEVANEIQLSVKKRVDKKNAKVSLCKGLPKVQDSQHNLMGLMV